MFDIVRGSWTPWSAWTVCSESCGKNGSRMRSRTCNNPAKGIGCSGKDTQVQKCFNGKCRGKV